MTQTIINTIFGKFIDHCTRAILDDLHSLKRYAWPESWAPKEDSSGWLAVTTTFQKNPSAIVSSEFCGIQSCHLVLSVFPMGIFEKHAESFKQAFVRWPAFPNSGTEGHKRALTLRLPVLVLSLMCYFLDGIG